MLGTKNSGKWWTRQAVFVGERMAEYRWWLREKGGLFALLIQIISNIG